MLSNKRGITLIALVITIIVLLILAGVTISMVVGDNGIVSKASNSATETKKAEARDSLEMAIATLETEFVSAHLSTFLSLDPAVNGYLTIENLNAELAKYNYKIISGSFGTGNNWIEITTINSNTATWKCHIAPKGSLGAEITDFQDVVI